MGETVGHNPSRREVVPSAIKLYEGLMGRIKEDMQNTCPYAIILKGGNILPQADENPHEDMKLDETILFGSGMEMTDFASPGVFGTVFLGLTKYGPIALSNVGDLGEIIDKRLELQIDKKGTTTKLEGTDKTDITIWTGSDQKTGTFHLLPNSPDLPRFKAVISRSKQLVEDKIRVKKENAKKKIENDRAQLQKAKAFSDLIK
jgi:hypothetical protein